MYRNKKISLVLPCLNEERGLKRLLPRVPDSIDQIVVVDNNSTDQSAAVAQRFERVVLAREKIRGYGRAYQRGFKVAAGDIIITMDSDNTYPVSEIEKLLDIFWRQKIDFLSASRFPLAKKSSMAFLNRIGNYILTQLFYVLTAQKIRDSQSGMWIFKKDLLGEMNLQSKGMAFSEEIKMEAVLNPEIRFAETHISYSERLGRVKLCKWRDGFQNLVFILRKRWEFFSRQ